MEKKANVFIIAILVLLVLVGGFFFFNNANSSSDNGQGIAVVEKSDSQVSEETNDEITPDQTLSKVKEFNIIAKQWDFSPNTITVNEGDTVILNIQSIDVTHGFVISEFGVSEQLTSGNTVKVEFTADKKGTFSFFCNVFCGAGHSRMSGKLVVK